MRVAIATSGRFHVLDLARELNALGHDVVLYSYLPVKRALRFGLPASCQRSLLLHVLPLIALLRVAPRRARARLNWWLLRTIDMLVARALEPCDVFIGMSGLCVLSCITARCKYGARVLLERGSTHILRQKEILEKLGGGRVADFDVERELAGYNLADLIVVPSLHAEDSFLRYGFDKQKIFRNPYGVDLEMFPATAVPATREPVAIYVGAWTYQKGCDLWGRVLERIPGLRLIHVGARGDAPMPVSGNFAHVDPVNQWDLLKYYAKAHVCVQASRQEGLSLVLIQALACGLPVVCSDQTGGRDLLQILQDDELVQVFPGDNLDALCSCIRRGMDFALARRGMRSLPEQQRRQLTWRAYGERYSRRLNELVVGRSSSSPRS